MIIIYYLLFIIILYSIEIHFIIHINHHYYIQKIFKLIMEDIFWYVINFIDIVIEINDEIMSVIYSLQGKCYGGFLMGLDDA